ncbi:alanine--tRNA ligase, mitochondrial [Brachyhypopomus gauderio]|uniref:alanine--tRNA ligase, mitochondrial n=1 Tax=Brachyhypopomus gauderio TaxID=698409 RepID=UPI004041E1F8
MAARITALSLCRRLSLDVGLRKFSGSARRCSVLSRSQVHDAFTSKRVRRMFIDFFKEQHEHRVVPSSPVRPRGDPSLLFVNAGMNQFKPILLGCADPRSEMASYRRVVNSQKCVRAGGKHNDLEDVGRDVYHHTFFEMLGNWSFGDYFKVEACAMAWRLLTEVYGIPAERLYVSYFSGDAASGLPADEETREIWLNLGVSPDHVLPFGMRDNFWEMGETGPCGPCTEIHYDHVGNRHAGKLINADSPDVVEIWNLVFMQYNREADGVLHPLPQCSVDTGMGLERLVTLLQGRRSNYDTDLFTPLLSAIHQRSKSPAYRGRTGEEDDGKVDMAYRVVADHVRTLCVCVADGVYPGMTGAELVLRRILRRAVRFSTEVLKAPEGTLASLVPTVAHMLGDVYPELHTERHRIMEIININESQFLSSLRQGRRVIDRTLSKMDAHDAEFPASVAWSLHRNLGFPLDLVHLMLEERGVAVDRRGLEQLAAQQEKLQSQSEGGAGERGLHLDLQCLAELQSRGVPHTDDSPKYSYSLQQDGTYAFPRCSSTVVVLYCNQRLASEVEAGQRCGVVLERTCFYAEQGGQTHDLGYFTKDGLQDVLFPVECVHLAGGYVVHEVTATETLRVGDQIQLHVDTTRRVSCMVKHTATHVLNFALRDVLGSEVVQRGSHVTADRLRFDFSSKTSLSVSQLQEVERLVQKVIQQNHMVHTQEVPLAQANQIEGLRTVDELYPDPVRVVSVGLPVPELLHDHTPRRVSVELCCGTHLLRTGGIQDLVIVSERQMVKGISRVIAVTGDDAKQAREAGQALLEEVESLTARITANHTPSSRSAQRLSKEVGLLTDAVEGTPIPQWQRRELQTRLKSLQRQTNTVIRKLEIKEAAAKALELLKRHSDKTVLVDTLETDSISVVMKTVNQLSEQTPHTFIMLLSHLQPSGRVLCACQVPKGQTCVSASEWALAVCGRLGGNAGGSATVAKGVGMATDITSLLEALRWAEEFAHSKQNTLHAQ